MTPTIVLIHGLWMTPLSWENWIERHQRQGYRVLAPAWPGMEADIGQLRRDPSPMLPRYERAYAGANVSRAYQAAI